MIPITLPLLLIKDNFEDFVFDGIAQPVFSAGSIIMNGDSACIDIPIEDDDDVEGDEEFRLEIIAVLLGNVAVPSTTTVTITDDTGVYALLNHELYIHVVHYICTHTCYTYISFCTSQYLSG